MSEGCEGCVCLYIVSPNPYTWISCLCVRRRCAHARCNDPLLLLEPRVLRATRVQTLLVRKVVLACARQFVCRLAVLRHFLFTRRLGLDLYFVRVRRKRWVKVHHFAQVAHDGITDCIIIDKLAHARADCIVAFL